MTDINLPQFMVIGAVKAATTWIQSQLQAHPGIFMPDAEPHFFSTEYQKGFEFYADFFSGAQPGQLVGEKSADYLAHEHAPERIAKILPKIPLIVQLRNPIDRAYSDYKMLYRRGTISGPPEDYLTHPDCDQPRCLLDGRYAHHIRRWFDHFDAAQIHILLFEDVKQTPKEAVFSVCNHIGAPPHFADNLAKKRVNDGGEKFLPLSLRKILAPFKDSVAPFRDSKWFEDMRSLIARPVQYPELSDDLRRRMARYYAHDVEELGQLLGRDLSHWISPALQTA